MDNYITLKEVDDNIAKLHRRMLKKFGVKSKIEHSTISQNKSVILVPESKLDKAREILSVGNKGGRLIKTNKKIRLIVPVIIFIYLLIRLIISVLQS